MRMTERAWTGGSLALTMVLLFAWSERGAEAAPSAPVEGRWVTSDGEGIIEVDVAPDGTLIGTRILWGFQRSDATGRRWASGSIYDPNDGKTYSCKLELDGETLRIRGYVGIPLFGRTEVWTREGADSAD